MAPNHMCALLAVLDI